ncbi:unnamed protein product, partial [Mesorhabditis spiculigera]
MSPPTVMMFPHSKGADTVKRSLILRNPTIKDLVVKLVPSCPKALQLEGGVLLLQARKYAPMSVTLVQKAFSSHLTLSIYARPIERHNHAAIQQWIKNDDVAPRQLVTKIEIKNESGFAATDTIIDLPGRAALFEAVTVATEGVDIGDAITCNPIDGDCATAPQMNVEEMERLAKAKLGEEKCWLFGPIVDALFPAADGAPVVIEKQKEELKPAPADEAAGGYFCAA